MFCADVWAVQAAATAGTTLPPGWPFGPGFGEGLFPFLVKALLVLVVLGGMALLLRWLFGPGGPMRDKEFDAPDQTCHHDDHPTNRRDA